MYRGKYVDLLLDGRWKIKGMFSNGTYTLENIYNHNTINISNRQLKRAINGEESISQIICRRIGNNSSIPIDNRTVQTYSPQIANPASNGER